jgi:hypothetical protein
MPRASLLNSFFACSPQVPEVNLGKAITCCLDRDCQKLETFVWRHAIDIMIFDENWCPVRLYYPPLKRTFNGLPGNACDMLACFSTELFKPNSYSWKRDELPPDTRIRMRPGD